MSKTSKPATKPKDQLNPKENYSSFDIVKAFCEKAMGHGLVSTEEEKTVIETALDEIEADLSA